MRQSKIGGELGDQGRYAQRKVANGFAVIYTESASSVPRIPEIEDYVQGVDVVRRRFGGQSLVAQGTVWISNGVVSSCWILVLKDVAVGAWSSRTLDSLNLMGLDI